MVEMLLDGAREAMELHRSVGLPVGGFEQLIGLVLIQLETGHDQCPNGRPLGVVEPLIEPGRLDHQGRGGELNFVVGVVTRSLVPVLEQGLQSAQHGACGSMAMAVTATGSLCTPTWP